MEDHSILYTPLMGMLIGLVGGQIIVLIVWLLAKLKWARIQNDQCAPPPPWKIKHQYIVGSVAVVLLFVLAMIASIYFSK